MDVFNGSIGDLQKAGTALIDHAFDRLSAERAAAVAQLQTVLDTTVKNLWGVVDEAFTRLDGTIAGIFKRVSISIGD